MPPRRLAIALVARAAAAGVPEALVGDVLEEVDGGRSHRWLWQQVVGLYWLALRSRLRHLERPSPAAIALAMGAMLLLAAAVTPPWVVAAAWLTFYYVMGAASLFTQMAAHASLRADHGDDASAGRQGHLQRLIGRDGL